MKKQKINHMSGITLIALVVIIIVLLILAGISIMMLTGDNGILTRGGETKEKTEQAQLIEDIQLDILDYQTSKLNDEISENKLEEILSKYGILSDEKRTKDKKLTITDGKYVIPVSKIYNGQLKLSPKISDLEPKEYYGQIIDYDVDIGVSLDNYDEYDWKIFYNDETNIYIIAEDYVRMDNSLMPTITGRIENSSNPYNLYWDWSGGNIANGKNGSVDIFETNFSNKFLTDWKSKVTSPNNASTNSNAKMTATLVDVAIWSYNSSTGKGFTNSAKIQSLNSSKVDEFFATGGPTIEMWVKSWNQKHGTSSDDSNKLQLYYASNAIGYFIGTSKNPDINSSYAAFQGGTTGYTDQLYYPHRTEFNNCYGYWIASPSADGVFRVMYIEGYGSTGRSGYHNDAFGIRPVVCLPSDLTVRWNETDEVWNIIKK